MKKFTIFITLLFVASSLKAQDIIVLNSGKSIQSKITEVLSFSIEYKEFDSLAGPAYSVNKSDVFVIIFENGKKEIITPPPTAKEKNPTEENEIRTFPKKGTFLLSGSSSLSYSSTTMNYFTPALGATIAINQSFAIEPEINYMSCLKHQYPNQIGIGFAFVYIF